MGIRRVPSGTWSTLRKLNRRTLGEALLTVSGASRDVLKDAPKERTKHIAMGAVLVSTAAIAAVSATYALHLALHLPVPFAAAGRAGLGPGHPQPRPLARRLNAPPEDQVGHGRDGAAARRSGRAPLGLQARR